MAATKPPGKGVTSIASSPSDGMICAMFIVGEVFMCDGGRSESGVFFPPKISEMRLLDGRLVVHQQHRAPPRAADHSEDDHFFH